LVFEKPNGYFRTLFVEQLEQLQIWTFIQNQHGNTKTQLLFGVLPFVKNYPEQRSTVLIFQVQLEFDFRGSIFLDLETKISVLEACPVCTSQDLNQQSLNLLTVAAVGGQMVMALQTLGSVRCTLKNGLESHKNGIQTYGKYTSRWWFQVFFIFASAWGRFPF